MCKLDIGTLGNWTDMTSSIQILAGSRPFKTTMFAFWSRGARERGYYVCVLEWGSLGTRLLRLRSGVGEPGNEAITFAFWSGGARERSYYVCVLEWGEPGNEAVQT